MTLREIDQAIIDLFDMDTGNPLDESAYEYELQQMLADKNRKEENVKDATLYFRQLEAEEVVLKKEIANLQEKLKDTGNKMNRIKSFIDRILDGERFHHPLVDVRYRKSHYLDIKDKNAVIEYCQRYGYSDCLKQKPIEVSVSDVTRLIKEGIEIPGAEIAERYNLGVK